MSLIEEIVFYVQSNGVRCTSSSGPLRIVYQDSSCTRFRCWNPEFGSAKALDRGARAGSPGQRHVTGVPVVCFYLLRTCLGFSQRGERDGHEANRMTEFSQPEARDQAFIHLCVPQRGLGKREVLNASLLNLVEEVGLAGWAGFCISLEEKEGMPDGENNSM